jgi:hypothetical protein
MTKIIRIISFVVLLLVPVHVYSHADMVEIEVVKLVPLESNEYELHFKRKGVEDTQIIYIRYDPKRAVGRDYLPITKENYLKAAELLQRRAIVGMTIEICRISGAGYSPIEGKVHEYRSNAMYVSKPGAGKDRICLCPSVWGTSPD